MGTCLTLPDGWEQEYYVNLRADQRIRRKLNIASFLLGGAILAAAWLLRGVDALLALLRRGVNDYLLWLAILAVCALAFLALHELTHGLCMRLLSGYPPRFGRKGLLLFTGSEAYFSRRDFSVVMLAPAVLFTVVFVLLAVFLQDEWFWFAVALLVVNLGGAVGDFCMTYRALREPKTALFRVNGAAMAVYTEKNEWNEH